MRLIIDKTDTIVHPRFTSKEACYWLVQIESDENETYKDITQRMTLLHGDAKELIPTLNAEVILIDPMHPPRQKSALVKKEMRLIRDIVGTDPDATELMQIALKHATARVILKWPLRAAPMQGIIPPSHQITGKSTRYDVFIRM